jgi:hypothetical protein
MQCRFSRAKKNDLQYFDSHLPHSPLVVLFCA